MLALVPHVYHLLQLVLALPLHRTYFFSTELSTGVDEDAVRLG